MVALPDPMDTAKKTAMRILPDTGIKQIIKDGLLKITPETSFDNFNRFQPATIDVQINSVYESATLNSSEGTMLDTGEKIILSPNSLSTIVLEEKMVFPPQDNLFFFSTLAECRSTLRRFGAFLPTAGMRMNLAEGNALEIGNYGPAGLYFNKGDKVAQFFITVNPFADIFRYDSKETKSGQYVRSLPMGVEVDDAKTVQMLRAQGYFRMNTPPKFHLKTSYLTVHASTIAHKLIAQDIDLHTTKFSLDYFEPVKIGKSGLTLQPGEHYVIETVESFDLGNQIGIWFWDNLTQDVFRNVRNGNLELLGDATPFLHIPDGWIDPGYCGGFSRQPKWVAAKTIFPGDVIGYGKVFYFPQEVEHSYGAKGVSHYHEGGK